MRRGTCAGSGPRGGPASPVRPSLGSAGVLTPSVHGSSRSGSAALRALILSPGPAPPATGGAHPPWLRLRAAPGGRRTSPDAPPSPAPRDPTAGASQRPAARSVRGLARPGTWGEWQQGPFWVPGLAGPRRAVFRLLPTRACAPRGCPAHLPGAGAPLAHPPLRPGRKLGGGRAGHSAGSRGAEPGLTSLPLSCPLSLLPPLPQGPPSRCCTDPSPQTSVPSVPPAAAAHPEVWRPGGITSTSQSHSSWAGLGAGILRLAFGVLWASLAGPRRPRPGLCLLSSGLAPRPRGTRSSPGSGLRGRGSFCGPRADPSQDPVSARVKQGAKRRRALPTWSANRLEPRGSNHTRIGTRFPGTARKATAVDTGSGRTDSESLLR